MESEAYFLHIIYRLNEKEVTKEYTKEHPEGSIGSDDYCKYIYNSDVEILRASMQRRDHEAAGVKYSRVKIDFDPLQKQVGYVVVIRGFSENTRERFTDVVHIVGIFLTEDEANKTKKEIEDGGYQNYMVKDKKRKEVYEKTEVHAALISDK